MPLVIVESPTKARTLSRLLGKDFQVEATYGHVRDLPANKLGVEIKKTDSHFEFIPDYQIIADKKKRVLELKKLALVQKEIVLATDPDREGEAIAFHIKHLLEDDARIKKINPPVKRIVFHEITSTAISHALSKAGVIDEKLVEAQAGRRLLDRLVGYKLSPLLWNKLGKRWLSAGRVQTVAVRLIVEREREIQAFIPVEYWYIDATFEGEKDKFTARLTEIDGKKAEIKSGEESANTLSKLKEAAYEVSKIENKQLRRSPPPPFITSTLQQTAVNKFGWSAKKTMRAAQNLYEEGLISYHRTDSTNLAAEAVMSARAFISEKFGAMYLPPDARAYKTKSKVAQEAHEAIRPTSVSVLAENDAKISGISGSRIPESLGREGQLLYSLIWRRFLGCQMAEAVIDQTAIFVGGRFGGGDIKTEFTFKTAAQQVKFDGYLKLYEKKDEIKNGMLEKIPDVRERESLNLSELTPLQKFTEPPARFNEASLIKALEELGIGRPSTYAPIISTIEARKYVEKIERRLAPTDLGFAVNDFLIKYFPVIFDVKFTANMEDELDEIANGKLNTDKVLNDFYAPFARRLDEVFKEAERVKVNYGETDEKCPQCGSPLAIKMSRFGKFLACSNYPTCKFTKNWLEKTGILCPKCNSDIVVKKTRRGKQFYGCSAYPKCDFAAWKKEDIK